MNRPLVLITASVLSLSGSKSLLSTCEAFTPPTGNPLVQRTPHSQHLPLSHPRTSSSSTTSPLFATVYRPYPTSKTDADDADDDDDAYCYINNVSYHNVEDCLEAMYDTTRQTEFEFYGQVLDDEALFEQLPKHDLQLHIDVEENPKGNKEKGADVDEPVVYIGDTCSSDEACLILEAKDEDDDVVNTDLEELATSIFYGHNHHDHVLPLEELLDHGLNNILSVPATATSTEELLQEDEKVESTKASKTSPPPPTTAKVPWVKSTQKVPQSMMPSGSNNPAEAVAPVAQADQDDLEKKIPSVKEPAPQTSNATFETNPTETAPSSKATTTQTTHRTPVSSSPSSSEQPQQEAAAFPKKNHRTSYTFTLFPDSVEPKPAHVYPKATEFLHTQTTLRRVGGAATKQDATNGVVGSTVGPVPTIHLQQETTPKEDSVEEEQEEEKADAKTKLHHPDPTEPLPKEKLEVSPEPATTKPTSPDSVNPSMVKQESQAEPSIPSSAPQPPIQTNVAQDPKNRVRRPTTPKYHVVPDPAEPKRSGRYQVTVDQEGPPTTGYYNYYNPTTAPKKPKRPAAAHKKPVVQPVELEDRESDCPTESLLPDHMQQPIANMETTASCKETTQAGTTTVSDDDDVVSESSQTSTNLTGTEEEAEPDVPTSIMAETADEELPATDESMEDEELEVTISFEDDDDSDDEDEDDEEDLKTIEIPKTSSSSSKPDFSPSNHHHDMPGPVIPDLEVQFEHDHSARSSASTQTAVLERDDDDTTTETSSLLPEIGFIGNLVPDAVIAEIAESLIPVAKPLTGIEYQVIEGNEVELLRCNFKGYQIAPLGAHAWIRAEFFRTYAICQMEKMVSFNVLHWLLILEDKMEQSPWGEFPKQRPMKNGEQYGIW
jgi:hypothetical protein